MQAASPVVTDLPAPIAAQRRPSGGPTIERLGGMAALALATVREVVRPPFAWRREFLIQTWSVVRRSLPAIAIAIMAWGFAGAGLQAGNFLTLFGSIDRAGGVMVVTTLPEFWTFVPPPARPAVACTML